MRIAPHLLILLSIVASFTATASRVTFPLAPNNTPYSLVAALPSVEPAERWSYAQELSAQYVLYWPALTNNSKGVVVFIHGGCWLDAYDIEHSKPLTSALAQQGYEVLSIEYRRSGNSGEWPVAFDDVSAALNTLTKLQERDVDISQITIMGHSAGGHLALLLGSRLADVLPVDVTRVNIIGLAAIVDIAQYAKGDNSCQRATPSFMQGTPNERPSQYHLASPLNYTFADPRIHELRLLQGQADTIVPWQQAKHPHAITDMHAEFGHFDWIHPGSKAFQTLTDVLEDSN